MFIYVQQHAVKEDVKHILEKKLLIGANKTKMLKKSKHAEICNDRNMFKE